MLNAIPDLLFEMDLQGRHLACHSPRAELLSVPIDQLLGRTVEDVMPPEAAHTCLAALHEAHAVAGGLEAIPVDHLVAEPGAERVGVGIVDHHAPIAGEVRDQLGFHA